MMDNDIDSESTKTDRPKT